MKNVLELDLTYCLDALKMLQRVLLSCVHVEQAQGRAWHRILL